jgi:hypothetical protein
LQEIKRVLKHTVGNYIIWATLRAEIAKELPLLSPRTSADNDIIKEGASRARAKPESSTTQTQRMGDPKQWVRMRDQPRFRPYSAKNFAQP